MANPRQRRKLRSGSHKAVRHSNHAKKNLKKQPPIHGPKVLQEAWDTHRTVRQNYEALGLAASLKPTASGGVERPLGVASNNEPAMAAESAPVASGSKLPKGYGRIVRDADGNVVDVQLDEEDEEEAAQPGRLVEDIPDPSAQPRLAEWVGRGGLSRPRVVQDLEELAETRGGPVARHSSGGELGVLRQLVAKHAHDVDAMARDRRLNADQRTAGQLSRAIKKAGGVATLLGGSVRCDLKDLPVSSAGQSASCTNCKERGLKCVDEFAEVKAVKLLRRGRRLQQAEAVFGKVPSEQASLRSVTPPQNVIPRLAPEFFDSRFFWRFQIQRPILEPIEYRDRYIQFIKGNADALQVPGQLIAMALAVWAASYGVNEYGGQDHQEHPADVRQRKEAINEMLQEILYLVDMHGILRKASWDGVRLLLLLLPLTQEIQSPMDRLVMYEATLSQVHNLCTLAPPMNSGKGEFIDALVRARIFWYAHILDGVTSGLRGGRIWLSDDDLAVFEGTLPARTDSSPGFSIYIFTFRYVAVPLRISSVCRIIHTALTGPMAKQREGVKEDLLNKVWGSLDRLWQDLEDLRKFGTGEIIEVEDMERFIHGWQIFIFECHNVVREALKGKLGAPAPAGPHPADAEAGRVTNHEGLSRLYEKAKSRCVSVVREVVKIIQRNLGSSFFQYDTSLVRDGCFFAAFLLAGEAGTANDVQVCIQALDEMRWVFSKSEERIQTIQMIWGARAHGQAPSAGSISPVLGGHSSYSPEEHSYPRKQPVRAVTMPSLSVTTGLAVRPPSASSAALSHDGSWGSTISTSSGSMHAHAEPSTHRTSPITSRTPPYGSASQFASASRAAKVPLVASSSALLSPTTSATLRTIQDSSYYYGAYGMSVVPEVSSSTASSSLAGPSTGTMHPHLSSYTGAGFHTDGSVPFAAPVVHQDPTMLQSSSTPEEDDDVHYNVTDRYY
ncbi:hypothetical protein PHLGIDRAFT_126553 [Phlebiopsis gigantea 11061_1 CR5-6]|uniref:Nucleolar protein 16 n=1 Tax=Phlebiopsis gigantea (strain 11061_1 CR5-6) TaxID=745531 RepID=A0A0C3NUT9_PHLG1|nr:hypothetical protein PHLGIDRAFT_126553 [Phlebiopsis gigantea 11061_1 CR5-6]